MLNACMHACFTKVNLAFLRGDRCKETGICIAGSEARKSCYQQYRGMLTGRRYSASSNIQYLWGIGLAGDAATDPHSAVWLPCTVQLSAQGRQPSALEHILSNNSSAHPRGLHPPPCTPLTMMRAQHSSCSAAAASSSGAAETAAAAVALSTLSKSKRMSAT